MELKSFGNGFIDRGRILLEQRRQLIGCLSAGLALVGSVTAISYNVQDNEYALERASSYLESDCDVNPCNLVINLPSSVAEAEPDVTIPPTTVPETPPETTSTTAVSPVEQNNEVDDVEVTSEPVFSAAEVTEKTFPRGTMGADISWPNCNKVAPKNENGQLIEKLTSEEVFLRGDINFAIVGINDGEPFSVNRCLREQVSKLKQIGVIIRGVYLNTSLNWGQAQAENDESVHCPHKEESAFLCPAYRWGVRAGAFATQAAYNAGLSNIEWYFDVEVANKWSDNPQLNQVSLQGMMDASRQMVSVMEGIEPGKIYQAVYSNGGMWEQIMGNWIMPGIQTWIATAVTEGELHLHCGEHPKYRIEGVNPNNSTYEAMPVVMVQKVDNERHLDVNFQC